MSATIYTIEFRVTNSPHDATHRLIKAELISSALACQRRFAELAPYNRVQVVAYTHDFYHGHQDLLSDLGRVGAFNESAFAKTTG